MFEFGMPQPSRYLRVTWMLSSKTNLLFPDSSKVRFLSANEANGFSNQIQKRNIFARHSYENNFYLQRINELSDQTVIEVFRPGDPQAMGEDAEEIGDLIEKIVVLSSTLALPKKDLQKKLGISQRSKTEIDFITGPDFRYLRSRSRKTPISQGIEIDQRFSKRFSKCGFFNLYTYCLTEGKLQERMKLSLDWLFESRRESRLPASIVKTSIALESLLIFNESESLARSLSERMAFILSTTPETRNQISKIIKKFYNARSGVVHGSKKKLQYLSPNLVEAVDRLTILLYLTVSTNSHLWTSPEHFQEWCELERWGKPSTEIIVPYSQTYLTNAIKLSEKQNEV